jgi:murein DD-endopeptidase MepM/ murein hydrolase activator NlpD
VTTGRSAAVLIRRRNLPKVRVVNTVMRSITRPIGLLPVCASLALAACSRPVLYYPEPLGAGSSSPRRPATASAPILATAAETAGETVSASTRADIDYLRTRLLLVPVAGADMSKVYDTFDDPRDGGERVHRAIDILAPRGTPILSADDGRILRMSTNALGGISMYTVDPQNRIVYYYAHMDHYNQAMSPGREIVKGDTLGYVGTTGNAPKNLPHLHFQVMRWPADGKYWNGEPIDPYELLGGRQRE